MTGDVEDEIRQSLLEDAITDGYDPETGTQATDGCTCQSYVVDYSDPEPYHPENIDTELDPDCPVHGTRGEDDTSDCPVSPEGHSVGGRIYG